MNSKLQAALVLEAEYTKRRQDVQAKNEFNFSEKLAALGYTQEQYILERDSQYLSQIRGIDIPIDELVSAIDKTVAENGEALFIVRPSEKIVYAVDGTFDREYCDQNKVPYYYLGYKGGSIVATDKDLGLVLVCKKHSVTEMFFQKITFWVYANYLAVDRNNNDCLVDGKKVCAYATAQKEDYTVIYVQVSFSVDFELIKSICTKAQIKEPAGLEGYGDKTREDLLAEVISWLQ